MHKVALSGSRDFPDRRLVEHVIDRLIVRQVKVLVGCGEDAPDKARCTRGVDRWAHEYLDHMADEVRDYDFYYAEWWRLGKRAGMARNELMAHDMDELVALLAPGVPSPGTMDMITRARKKGVPRFVYHEGLWSTATGDEALEYR